MESALLGAARETPGLGFCAGSGNPNGAGYKNDVRCATGNHKLVPKCSEDLYHDNAGRRPSRWANLPISLRAVISGLLLTLAAVNVWPLLLLNLGHWAVRLLVGRYRRRLYTRPITDTGVDRPFVIACAAFTISLFMVLFAISRLRGRAQIAQVKGPLQ
jgi:hypothetical protein